MSLATVQIKFNPIQGVTVNEGPFTALTDGATIPWDYSSGSNKFVTLGGNRTLAITNVANGQSGMLIVKQDATGFRTLTLPAGSLHPGGYFDLSPDPNSVDVLHFFYDGTNYFWTIVNAFQ